MPKRAFFEISFRHMKPIFRIYFSTFLLGGGVVKKVNLKSSRYILKPKIGQLGHLEPFFLFFYISTGGLEGGEGGMVEEVDVEAFRFDLTPQHG